MSLEPCLFQLSSIFTTMTSKPVLAGIFPLKINLRWQKKDAQKLYEMCFSLTKVRQRKLFLVKKPRENYKKAPYELAIAQLEMNVIALQCYCVSENIRRPVVYAGFEFFQIG